MRPSFPQILTAVQIIDFTVQNLLSHPSSPQKNSSNWSKIKKKMLLAKKNNLFCTWAFVAKLAKWLRFTKLVGKMMSYFTYKLTGSRTHAKCRRCKFYSMPILTGAGNLCRNPPHATEQHSWAATGTQSDQSSSLTR